MQASDSRKRAAEGDGGMVQVPAELVETLREAERHYRMTHAGEFANSLEYAARALVDAVEKPAPTVPRIARSIDELRVGMVVAVSGPFGSGVVRTVERVGGPWVTAGKFDTDRKIHPEDVANGYVVILSEPPAPTLPTTPGSAAWMEWVHDKPINQGDGPARAAFIAGYEAAREANDGNV